MPILKHEERLGQLLAGRYRMDSIIGRGGMGVVFRGLDLQSRRPVAIKLLHYEYVERPEIVSRFIREANMMRDLTHPHIVGIVDLGQEEDGTVFIALEFLAGKSLGDTLSESGVMGPAAALDVLLPVMEALQFAHENGVVHRDLKPDNILVSVGDQGKMVPKLLDFGIAKALGDGHTALTQTGFVLGTPEYMAPEQAMGSDGIGPASDVYSMAVVWYECLTGTMPTGDLQGTAILLAAASGRITTLAERATWLPAELTRVIDRAMATDPRNRYASMALFRDDVAHACGAARDTGKHEPPPNLLVRRNTGLNLRAPAKNSLPTLSQFGKPDAYSLGPSVGEGDTELRPSVSEPPRSPSANGPRRYALFAAVSAAALLGLGVAYRAMTREPTTPALATTTTTTPPLAAPTPVPAPVLPRVPVPTVVAQPAPEAATQPTVASPSYRPSRGTRVAVPAVAVQPTQPTQPTQPAQRTPTTPVTPPPPEVGRVTPGRAAIPLENYE
ncbi:MAG: serine/threonine-protein kinase [Deltaproteobacteria bacterium]|nr:serine/threonine-protein kinase [Deltaproteobacteria bacterium]